MNRTPLALAAALVSGVVFGAGLALARMIDPQKVKDFLDIAAIPSGGWDPSLAFVMGGGVLVFFVGFRLAPPDPQAAGRARLLLSGQDQARPAADRRLGAVRHRLGRGRLLPRPGHRQSGADPGERRALRRRHARRLVAGGRAAQCIIVSTGGAVG